VALCCGEQRKQRDEFSSSLQFSVSVAASDQNNQRAVWNQLGIPGFPCDPKQPSSSYGFWVTLYAPGSQIFGLLYSQTTGPLAYGYYGSSQVCSVIDTASLNVIANIPTGVETSGLAISPNCSFVYATNITSGTVSIISAGNNTGGWDRHCWQPPLGCDLHARWTLAYVANGPSNNVSVINVASQSVVATIPIVTDGSGDRLIALTKDGSRAFVPNPVGRVLVQLWLSFGLERR
jgi:YVTN family beta-propeller protein